MAKKRGTTKKSTAGRGSRSGKIRSRKRVKPPRDRHVRRRGRWNLLYTIVARILMVIAVTAGTLALFRVDTVEVSGNERYTAEEIAAASGIEINDNLFLMNKFSVQSALSEVLPYVGDVEIQRTLPGTVHISVEECEPVAAVRISNGYWYIDAAGKLLEMREQSGGLIQVSGISLLSPTGGAQLTVDTAYRLKQSGLVGVLTALEGHGLLENVVSIDLSDGSYLLMEYTDKYTVKIPYGSDYDYKVRAMQGIVEALAEQNDEESGLIDLTLEEEWHFIPE